MKQEIDPMTPIPQPTKYASSPPTRQLDDGSTYVHVDHDNAPLTGRIAEVIENLQTPRAKSYRRTVQSYSAPTLKQIKDLVYLADVPLSRITVETWEAIEQEIK